MPEIVLASTSRYRRAQLDALGVPYVAAKPDYEEDHTLPIPVAELVVRFARGKAESLAGAYPDALIAGGDQAAELDGKLLGKPGTRDKAVAQLMSLQGRTHRLWTALALHHAKSARTEVLSIVHEMKMRPLARAQVEAYVDRELPVDCAGAYKIESLGVLMFEEMRGVDHSAIVGLPITSLSALLARFGVDLFDLALPRAT